MIHFRWREIGWADDNCTLVDGKWCVLQYRSHFIPTLSDSGDIVLQEARECDSEWKDVQVDKT